MKNLIVIILLLIAQQNVAQQANEESLKMFHQFDFWIGHWDVYKYGTDVIVGESRIEPIIDGIGLLENYSAKNSPYAGKSLNKYNPAKEHWEQYWIDNSGLTLFLSGGIVDQKMVLNDTEYVDPSSGFNKIVWEKLNDNTLRQTWSISKDNGQNWIILFDGEYKRRQPSIE
ncbi:MAG: DUF1579 family protein [Bacteroidetes bacterium]|nr:DUF1579 family protein [Bacteroidota bacterium]